MTAASMSASSSASATCSRHIIDRLQSVLFSVHFGNKIRSCGKEDPPGALRFNWRARNATGEAKYLAVFAVAHCCPQDHPTIAGRVGLACRPLQDLGGSEASHE